MTSRTRQTGSDLLLKAENVKYRQTGPGKSPIGQRVSPPTSSRVQLQICMNNDNQATFVFLKPNGDAQTVQQERDLVKETLQQALGHHRQAINQMMSRTEESSREFQIKKKTLEENAHLQSLYLHLVKEKLITPQDFWTLHYKPEEQSSVDKGGISGGFLSSLVSSESGINGIKLNLTTDTIQQIFKTYPAVERKHLELVPHEMNDQEFWTKFFQSHYFHRERSAEVNPNDPFADCVKMDEKDMQQIIEQGERSLKRHLNLSNLNEDFGVLSEMRDSNIAVRGNTAKAILVKRCNYHSGRVLSTIRDGPSTSGLSNGTTPVTNGNTPSKPPSTMFELALESQELVDFQKETEDYASAVNMEPKSTTAETETIKPAELARFTDIVTKYAIHSILTEDAKNDFFDAITGETDDEMPSTSDEVQFFVGKDKAAVEKIRIVHMCSTELLRHFWACFPPTTPDLEEKLVRMNDTLAQFANTKVRECEAQFGKEYVAHCREMLEKARAKFEAYSSLSMIHRGFLRLISSRSCSTFGSARKEGQNFVKAEELVRSWRSLWYPRDACGGRSYFFAGSLANLENAILEYVMDTLKQSGEFEYMHVDDILPLATTSSCGMVKEGEDSVPQYLLDNLPDYCLSGTAEMGIAHNLRGKIFEERELPKFYMARSRCFRPEIAQTAKESALYRVHEFSKIEMFGVCTVHDSETVLSKFTDIQKQIFSGLELHCRLIEMPKEDLNPAASRKFDVEAWMPGRRAWGELSSASNCTDYQAKGLDIRYKSENGEVKHVHTCNGTAIATTRAMIAVLETHQDPERKRFNQPEVVRERLPAKRNTYPLRAYRNPAHHKYNFTDDN
ncbi:tRNA synthetase class II core domain (G, h, p, S and t) domain-containing protein [Ditylenchus destructor]|nr:tRNA synthetase class II core domain (G, h, p, S and t) domain-containing protein [Ditylenchus destructor]